MTHELFPSLSLSLSSFVSVVKFYPLPMCAPYHCVHLQLFTQEKSKSSPLSFLSPLSLSLKFYNSGHYGLYCLLQPLPINFSHNTFSFSCILSFCRPCRKSIMCRESSCVRVIAVLPVCSFVRRAPTIFFVYVCPEIITHYTSEFVCWCTVCTENKIINKVSLTN